MLHLAKSENVRGVVEDTVDIIMRGGTDDKKYLEDHKKRIIDVMESFFQLSIEAIVNYDTDKGNENCEECDLLMLCLRLVEGVESWKEDTPTASLINEVVDASNKEEREILRYIDLDFE